MINIVYIDISKMLALSEKELERYSREDIAQCITNRVQVDDAMDNPLMCFRGPNGPVLAVVKI